MTVPRKYYDEAGIEIWHGDCREILPTIASNSVDFIFTDPPYGHTENGSLQQRREAVLGWKDGVDVYRDGKEAAYSPIVANDDKEGASGLVKWFFGEARRVLMPGCCCCCCCCGGGGPDPQFARWSLWMDEAIGFKQAVVWDKGGLGMGWHYRRNYELVLVAEKPGAACRWYGGHDQPNVVRISGIKPREWQHPTEKPEELVRLFMRLHAQPGNLVVDPFCGGGTTLVAARDMGMRAIGCELSERFCELAAKRLAQGVFSFT